MKLKLSHKLSLILLLTVVLSGALSSFFISRTARNAFLELVRGNDVRLAAILSENVATYYQRSGSWADVEQILSNPSPRSMPGRQMPGMQHGMGQAPVWGGPGQTPPQSAPQLERNRLRMLICDAQGNVVAHNLDQSPPERLGREVLEQGAPINTASGVIGYLFVESMLEPVTGPFQRSFLLRIYRAIVLSSLLVGIAAVGIGFVLMRHITKPLIELQHAVLSVAQGSYTYQINLKRRDEIGELANSFHTMAEKIRAADEWKRKLIADSAHELRTPVSLLQGNIEMMLDGIYPLNMERLKLLHEETSLLQRLVKELEDLAHAEADISEYHFERSNLSDLLRSTIDENSSPFEKKEIKIQVSYPQNDFQVNADRHKFRQVLGNVMQNALRYTPKGGRIVIDLESQGAGTARIAIEDDGPGIPESERKKIFERFYRVDSDRNRSSGGSGLGLAIAREIVERHGGRIGVAEPRKLDGARLYIDIPIV